MIDMTGITKVYQLGDMDVPILKGIDLTIEASEYVSIMGASGSGKSTLMNIIGCLDSPTEGRYHLEGRNLTTLDKDELAFIRNQKIGFIFQQFNLLPRSTAVENVMLPMVYGGIATAERRDRATAALERVGLSDRMVNKPAQLSGGQQQRVAIARAIVNQPLLGLADEPTGALDSQTTRDVLALFQDLNASGITVVMVTHEPDVARTTQRIIWFRDGEIVNDHLSPQDIGHLTMAA